MKDVLEAGPGKTSGCSFSGLPERTMGCTQYSKENNRGGQADESPDPSLGRKCGKGGNKEACGYF